MNCAAKAAGNGSTTAKPWRSLATVNAHAAFQPGDQILIKRGTTCKGRLHPKGSGASGAPITIGAWGSGAKPTIAGGGTPTLTGAVDLRNQQWWTIQDLRVTNTSGSTSTQAYRAGVSIRNQDAGVLRGIIVQRLKVEHVASAPNEKRGSSREWGGITVAVGGMGGDDSFPDLQIRNNNVAHVGRTGIAVMNWEYPQGFNQRVRITANKVTRARGDGIVVFGAKNSRIDNNVVAYAGNQWPCPLCGGVNPNTANAGIWPARSENVRIDHNEVYGMQKLGGDGAGLDVDLNTKNTVLEYNYVHDNEGGGILFCGSTSATARFNILENNARTAFVFIGSIPANKTRIYNNTVYSRVGNDAKVVHTQGIKGGKAITFFNNLIYNLDDSGYYTWPNKPKTYSNTYVGVHGMGEPDEVGKQYDDPGVVNPGSGGTGLGTLRGYRPTSPKNDPVGSPIPKSVKVDFFGKTINWKKPPRGAAG